MHAIAIQPLRRQHQLPPSGGGNFRLPSRYPKVTALPGVNRSCYEDVTGKRPRKPAPDKDISVATKRWSFPSNATDLTDKVGQVKLQQSGRPP